MVENGEGKSKFTNLLTKYVFINSFFFWKTKPITKINVFLMSTKYYSSRARWFGASIKKNTNVMVRLEVQQS